MHSRMMHGSDSSSASQPGEILDAAPLARLLIFKIFEGLTRTAGKMSSTGRLSGLRSILHLS